MTINDAKDVVISAVNQLYGAGILPVADGSDPSAVNITALDQSTIVDIGKAVTASNTIGENFIAKCIDVLGKIVMDSRDYIPEMPSLFVDAIDWGGFVEHVHVGLSDVMTDEAWNDAGFINYSNTTLDPITNLPVGPQYAAHIAEVEHGYYAPRKHAKIFDKSSAVMVPLSVARDQMFTAFKSEGELTRFISLLYQSVQNTLKARAEVYALALVQTAIAIAADHLDSGASRDHVVHLATEWHALGGTDYTISGGDKACLQDPAFMSFALKRIAEVRDEFRRYSTAFNNGKDITFTPSGDEKLLLISQFARAAKFGVRAITYNEELLGVGDYDSITSWQAIRDTGLSAFDQSTTTQIQLSEQTAIDYRLNKSGNAWATGDGPYTATRVIGLMYDRYALGISLEREATTAKYIAANNVWNSFAHALYNMIINDDYNMCVFALD